MMKNSGYCQCGCGQKTKLASATRPEKDMIKGQPLKYLNGHNRTNRRVGAYTHLVCAHCKQELSVTEFYIRHERQTYRDVCKQCDAHRKRRDNYGLSSLDFNEMLTVQEGTCKICRLVFEQPKDIHVDHDHDTLLIRGLLCKHCNQGLGHFRDSVELLSQAINYLKGS